MTPVKRQEKMQENIRIRFCGEGGQGVVSAGIILGNAAVADGKNAIQTQSYGSEARGGACKCDVTIASDEIYELEPTEVDVLVAMCQHAYDTYVKSLSPNGYLVVDDTLVKKTTRKREVFRINATELATVKMGKKIFANIIMLGYLVAHLKLVSKEKVLETIRKMFPKDDVEKNIHAFEIGYEKALCDKK